MLEKELTDSLQVPKLSNAKAQPVTVIPAHHSAFKKCFERVEDLNVPLMLHDYELGQDLVSRRHLVVPLDSNEEATFSISEPNDPIIIELHRRIWVVNCANSDIRRMASEDPALAVSCGLSNPFHFYAAENLSIHHQPIDRRHRGNVGKALRISPHTAGYCPADYSAGRQLRTFATLGPL